MPLTSSITPPSGNNRTGRVIRPPSDSRPALYLLAAKAGPVIVKDYKAGSSALRALIGRILVIRERRAYERLGPTRGLVPYICAPDAFTICTGFIQGKSLDEAIRTRGLPASFFTELSELIEGLHRKGIVHCDLKRASNIIVDKEGRPFILDLAASIARSEARIFPLPFLYRHLELDDMKAVTKYMLRASPSQVTRRQAEAYINRSRPEKMIRALRNVLRRALKGLC